MEAKDTKFRCQGCGQLVTPIQNHPLECCESFKAGYKQSREEMDIQLTSLADLCLEHRKGGRGEVVEWLEKRKMYRYALIAGGRKEETFDIFIKCEMLQAQKEEWGI